MTASTISQGATKAGVVPWGWPCHASLARSLAKRLTTDPLPGLNHPCHRAGQPHAKSANRHICGSAGT